MDVGARVDAQEVAPVPVAVVVAQAGEVGNTVNPPTRDQDPATAKEAATGAKGKAAVAKGVPTTSSLLSA